MGRAAWGGSKAMWDESMTQPSGARGARSFVHFLGGKGSPLRVNQPTKDALFLPMADDHEIGTC